MADEKVGIKIEVDGKAAEKSVGNIRKEIKQATVALQEAQSEFGDYSEQAIAAAKRVAELRDRVAEAAETAKLFDPGAKFAAFSGAINAVAGGFAAVQGALGLVGVESQDLEKQLLKVQSALALSQGLSTITDSAKDFQRLNAVIQQTATFQKGLAAANLATSTALKAVGISATTTSVGFKVLRGAIISTGIGALAIGLILLVQNFDKVKKAVLNFIPGLGDAAAAIGRIYDRITDFIGITSEAQRQTERVLKANAAAIRATERELDINGDKYDEYTKRKIEANLRYRKSFEELTKDESLSIADRDKFIKEARERANRDIAAADADRQKQVDKAAADAASAESKRQQEAAAKVKAAQEERLNIQKQGEAELSALRRENQLAAIKDEDQRRIKQLELELKDTEARVNATKLSEELKTQIIVEARKKADAEIQAINQKAADEELAAVEKRAADEKELRDRLAQEATAAEIERKIASLEALKEIGADPQSDFDARAEALRQADELNSQYLAKGIIDYQKFVDNKKAITAAEVQIDNDKRAALAANVDAYGQLLGQVASLLGKNTAAGKAAAIAEATINTYLSASKAYQAMSSIPPAPLFGVLAAGVATAAGIKNVQAIARTQVPGVAGGGAAPSISVMGGVPPMSAAAPLAPARPSAQVFALDQQSIRGINAASQRAYVVESDITTSQERVKRLNRAARLG